MIRLGRAKAIVVSRDEDGLTIEALKLVKHEGNDFICWLVSIKKISGEKKEIYFMVVCRVHQDLKGTEWGMNRVRF